MARIQTPSVPSRTPVARWGSPAVLIFFTAGSIVPAAALGAGPAGAPPATYDLVLTGRVRDFPSTHSDFCKTPSFGQNWVEGALAPQLSADGRPVWQGGGKRVTMPARDAAGHNISSALIEETVLVEPTGVRTVTPAVVINNPSVDTWNPSIGAYGGSNVGPAPQMQVLQPMPSVTVPSLPYYGVEYLKDGSTTSTLSSSFRCGKFLIRNYHKLMIQGNVVVVVDEEFKVENHAEIELMPGATFTVYALKDAALQDFSKVNMNTWDHTRFTLYKMGTLDLFLQNNSQMCGQIICPNGRVFMQNNADIYASIQSQNLLMQNSGRLHVPMPTETACADVNDSPAQMGTADPASVASPQTFGQWFDDVPGVNMDSQARMVFSKDASGALKFSTNDFRPIDGKLLDQGAYGANHNFTMEMDGGFYYTPCSGQFFEFSGDGDAFVYVDGKLVLEMVGNNMGVTQYVDMDRLGLEPGEEHKLQFFYAQRSCGASRFSVRTNVELMTKYEVEMEAISLLD